MEIRERAAMTDSIINALSSGKMVEYVLQEETKATHNDLSFVEEQEFVSVQRSGLANSTIIYSLRQRGRDVFNANGLLNYLEDIESDKQKSLDKSELEKQIAFLQKDKLEYDQTIRERDAVIKKLQVENLEFSTTHLANQNKLHPVNRALKYVELFKLLLGIAGSIIGGSILEYNWQVVSRLIALWKP